MTQSAPPPPLRVLFADRDVQTCHALQRLLPTLGYLVTCVTTFATAQRLLENQEYHILICDPDLPDGDGLDLLRCAGRNFPTCGLVLSGAVGREAELRALSAGFAAHLVKPISATQLEEAIASALIRWKGAVRQSWNAATQRPPSAGDVR